MNSSTRWFRLIAYSIGMLCTQVGMADADIYLAEYKYNDPRLYVMEPGGVNVQELDIIPTSDWLVVGVQVDVTNGKIYWTHGSSGQGRIRRANLDGTDVEILISGLTNARGLALDVERGKMYWSDTQDNRMYRANLNGTGLETVIDTGHQLGRPTLDLVNGKIYFGNYGLGDMRRANLDGTDQEILFDGLFTPVAVALDLDNGKIYWADSNTSFVSNHIARANLDGSEFEVLYQGQGTSSGFDGIGLDLQAQKLYWCDEIEYTIPEKGVWEANLDGSEAQRIFASPAGWNAGAMAVVQVTTPCPGDLTGDEQVNIDDIFAVLGLWGDCPDPCPPYCAGDLTEDCTVNIDDIFAILGLWGPCD